VSAMANVTEHLGFGLTCSLSYEHPYPFARRMSTLDHLTNGRVGWNTLGGNLRLSGGINVGVAHVGASSCSDGLSCGAEFTRNPQLMPIDSWAMAFDVEGGISTLQGALGAYFRIGSMFGVNPRFDVLDSDGDVPNFGLNIPYLQVGVQAEVFSLIRAITGTPAASAPAADAESPESETATEETSADPGSESSAESATSPATGMALVRQRVTDVNAYLSHISEAGSAASAASAAYAAVEGDSVESNRDRRVQILEMVNQARNAADAVTHISELIEEARGGLSGITDAGERR